MGGCCRWRICFCGGETMKEPFVNFALSRKIAACLGTLSPSCKQAARLQSQALARPLSLPQRFGLRLHLLICCWCRRFGEQVIFLHSAAHQCPENEQTNAVRGLTAEGRTRIKRAMQATEEIRLPAGKAHPSQVNYFLGPVGCSKNSRDRHTHDARE
jgi:hypothetical protein